MNPKRKRKPYRLNWSLGPHGIEVDIMTRWWVPGVGIDIGCNKFSEGKPYNFFVEIHFLFWTFGIEIKRKRISNTIKDDEIKILKDDEVEIIEKEL